MTVEIKNEQVEDWDKTYPQDEISWVDDDMKEIQRDWIFWDRYHEQWGEIGFGEGQFTMNEGDEGEYKEEYQEVCVVTGADGGTSAIGDDFVFHKRPDALQKFTELYGELLPKMIEQSIKYTTPMNILLFKHSSENWSPACTVEWHGDSERKRLKVNKLGFGVFIQRGLLERLGIPYCKFKPTGDE